MLITVLLFLFCQRQCSVFLYFIRFLLRFSALNVCFQSLVVMF